MRKNIKKNIFIYIFLKFRKYAIVINTKISSFITKLRFYVLNISVGNQTKFVGTPIIYKYYDSTIGIGQKCTFRSDKISNLIGVNHKCIISTFKEDAIILIGDNCGFSGTVIGASEKIVIGNKVLCGANTLITDFDWHAVDPKLRHTPNMSKSAPVIIRDNVWLGIGVVVLKGVTIGENSIIGANSVVVKDIPANVVAAGNPCKILKSL